jgi:hypothetical protein
VLTPIFRLPTPKADIDDQEELDSVPEVVGTDDVGEDV